MKLYDTTNVDFSFNDARGSLTQLVHDGYKQVNVLETNKGVLRGGHYHKVCSEAFYVVSGSVETTLKHVEGGDSEKVVFSKGDFFRVFPFAVHSMYFPEDCLMVQMYDRPVEFEDGTKDIYPET